MLTFRFFCNGSSIELARYQPTLVAALWLHQHFHRFTDRKTARLLPRWKLSESCNVPADNRLCRDQNEQVLDEPFVIVAGLFFRTLERIGSQIKQFGCAELDERLHPNFKPMSVLLQKYGFVLVVAQPR